MHLHRFIDNERIGSTLAAGDPAPWPRSGASEVETGRLADTAFVATIERWIATTCYRRYTARVRTITQRQLRNESAAILRDVQAGQSMIVTRNGTPVAELKPVSPRRFVPRSVIAQAAATAPRIDAGRFRADLDAFVDQGVDV